MNAERSLIKILQVNGKIEGNVGSRGKKTSNYKKDFRLNKTLLGAESLHRSLFFLELLPKLSPFLFHPLLTSWDPQFEISVGSAASELPNSTGWKARKADCDKANNPKKGYVSMAEVLQPFQAKPTVIRYLVFRIIIYYILYIPQHHEQHCILSTSDYNILKSSEWRSRINYSEASNSNADSPVQWSGW